MVLVTGPTVGGGSSLAGLSKVQQSQNSSIQRVVDGKSADAVAAPEKSGYWKSVTPAPKGASDAGSRLGDNPKESPTTVSTTSANRSGRSPSPNGASRTPPPICRSTADASTVLLSLELSGPEAEANGQSGSRWAIATGALRRLCGQTREFLTADSRWLITACILGVAASMAVVWSFLRDDAQLGDVAANTEAVVASADPSIETDRAEELAADLAERSSAVAASNESSSATHADDAKTTELEIDLMLNQHDSDEPGDQWSAAAPAEQSSTGLQPANRPREDSRSDDGAKLSREDSSSVLADAEDTAVGADGAPIERDNTADEDSSPDEMAAEVEREETLADRAEQGASAGRSRMEARLSEHVPEVEFINAPLGRFIDFVRELSNLPILIDESAFQDAGKDRRSPITVRLSGATIGEILSAGLKTQSLRFELRDDRVLIVPSP